MKRETRTIQTWPGGASYEYRGDPDGPAKQRQLRPGYKREARWRPGTEDIMKRETRTIQTWPGGASFEYRGDPDGPAEQRQLRPGYNREARWMPGTEDEWRQIRIELRAEIYGDRDILGCDSALVDDLIKAAGVYGGKHSDLLDGFSYEEIRNIYKDPSDWTLEQCRDYIRDLGDEGGIDPNPWTMDRAALIELSDGVLDVTDATPTDTLREQVIEAIDDETIDGLKDWRDAARELAQDNPAEVYEWWRVTSWLCDQLDKIGEVTIDNGYGHWWGRTCTGQGYLMDGTLQQVAALHED